MICANCGTKNNDDVDFCPNCGGLIKQTGGDNASASTLPPVGQQESRYSTSTYHPASEWFDANRETRGKNFLLVVGIMSIIGGSMSIMIFVTSMAASGQLLGDIINVTIFNLFAGIYQLIMGIAGVKYCKVVKKAPMLLMMGILALVIPLIGLIETIVVFGVAFSFMGLIGFVLPVLFIIGAKMNMPRTTK
jgi:hypothetical protein